MISKRLLVFGGSGFIGQQFIARAKQQGHAVLAIVRSHASAEKLAHLPVDTEVDNHSDDFALEPFFAKVDTVINLVGILHETRLNTFESVHVDFPKRLLSHCQKSRVEQYVNMSALPASSAHGPSQYLFSRGRGEDAIHQVDSTTEVVSLRPSIVFGRDDHFLWPFAKIVRRVPIFPLVCPESRFAPVFVGDLIDVLLDLIAERCYVSETRIDLCGPSIYTFRELIQYLTEATNSTCRVVGLPDIISRLQARLLNYLPYKFFTYDNYLSLQADSVSADNGFENFGIKPKSLDSIMRPLLSG